MYRYSNSHHLDAIDELLYEEMKKHELDERNRAIELERQVYEYKVKNALRTPRGTRLPTYMDPSVGEVVISQSINAMPSTYIETPEDIQRRIDKRESDWLASLEREVQELEEREREEALQLEKERYFYSHWFIRWLLFIFKYKMNPKW